ncbi:MULTISPECIES: L-threonylcarbamoyladenylate synthase [Methylomonas]|uniref:Threonylcarbamoyl-AMP synthase n=1 Tax=Methylomonas koyamae TaxID=702114 RepID=A0A291IIS4_9GAMM|nr:MULTISPECIES: L-threonylcarbamoyladenylate synthase [Methylomonas]ANE55387.1 threonylcarbamoyl-AMP synthase [Methylomonas sp. DH-1]ATG90243.1 threonylcarbamoyl-AMP synthase [Methylomonas koyamae]OAI25345.1 threonylcarbamoyl-AMP synthase [Methylomonas koyamae]WNB77826.1 L-threonylcarbamoyladenylate synthase [Methylomonas koyamae]BBL58415.1 threonylcarbamoyl-AMP synthase [Methylomonas koyamae]
MAQYFEIHPKNPQPRLIQQTLSILREGGVIAYPTDTSYALGCQIGDKAAMDTIRAIRRLDDNHNFTLICTDLSQVSTFTKMGNDAHRLIKKLTPGPFTFLLDATREVPRRLQHPKKKTIGVRIPDHAIARTLVEQLGEPLLTTTLIMPGETDALADPYDIRQRLEKELALVIDGGVIEHQPTTVIACGDKTIEIVRQGIGIAPMLEAV